MKRDWKKVRKEVKEFVENEVYPAEEILHKRDDESAKKMQELMQKAKDNSLWALGHPEDIGGQGMPFMEDLFSRIDLILYKFFYFFSYFLPISFHYSLQLKFYRFFKSS